MRNVVPLILTLCYIDSCAYGVLTAPVLRVKCFSLQQVGYSGFPYDRHLLVETCHVGVLQTVFCVLICQCRVGGRIYCNNWVKTYTPWTVKLRYV